MAICFNKKKYANKTEIFVAISTVTRGFSQHPKMLNKLKTVEGNKERK